MCIAKHMQCNKSVWSAIWLPHFSLSRHIVTLFHFRSAQRKRKDLKLFFCRFFPFPPSSYSGFSPKGIYLMRTKNRLDCYNLKKSLDYWNSAEITNISIMSVVRFYLRGMSNRCNWIQSIFVSGRLWIVALANMRHPFDFNEAHSILSQQKTIELLRRLMTGKNNTVKCTLHAVVYHFNRLIYIMRTHLFEDNKRFSQLSFGLFLVWNNRWCAQSVVHFSGPMDISGQKTDKNRHQIYGPFSYVYDFFRFYRCFSCVCVLQLLIVLIVSSYVVSNCALLFPICFWLLFDAVWHQF